MALKTSTVKLWRGTDRQLLRKLQSSCYQMQARDKRIGERVEPPENPDAYFGTAGVGGTNPALNTLIERINYLLGVKV